MRFQNRRYEVDVGLAGRTVTLLIYPDAPHERPSELEYETQPQGEPRLVDPRAYARCWPSEPGPPALDSQPALAPRTNASLALAPRFRTGPQSTP